MAKSFQFDVPKQAKGKKLEEEFLSTAQTILKEQTVLRLYREKKISTGIAAKMLSLPLHPRLSDADVADVIEAVIDVARANRR